MKTRLLIFLLTLLILPLAGLVLSGTDLKVRTGFNIAAPQNISASVFTAALLLGYVLALSFFTRKITGNMPTPIQRSYVAWMAALSFMLCWLLVYLNLYTGNWPIVDFAAFIQLLFYTPLFALLVPAVLGTRTMLGLMPGLLKTLARGIAFTIPGGETRIFVLVLLAATGLMFGAVWPAQLFWLFWLSPLLLLVALQLLWHESTIFSGIKSGDWGRFLCAATAGMIVLNLAAFSYCTVAGNLFPILPNPLFAQFCYAVFGLVCLQLGDIVAENWRGKKREKLLKSKKPFPIPVIVKTVGSTK